MDESTAEHLAELVGQYVREALSRGDSVRVPELGTFRLERHPAQVETRPDGTTVLHPPRHAVAFIPDA